MKGQVHPLPLEEVLLINNAEKIKTDKKAIEDGSTAAEATRKIKFFELFRYASTADKALMFLGIFSSALAGGAYPLTTVVFGQLVTTFTGYAQSSSLVTPEDLVNTVNHFTLYFIYLAILTFVATYVYMGCFIQTGEKIGFRVRREYLRAVLRQNIAFFDTEGAGSITTRINTDTALIQDAVSEKIPLATSQLCTTISGFVIAFVKSYRLTLVLLCIFPLIAASAAISNLLATRYQTLILEVYSTAGSIAEESFSSARTVIAFNAQQRMSKLYSTKLSDSRAIGQKKSLATGVGISSLFFIIYLGYSLAFWYGAQLLAKGEITSGDITTVFFSILIGAFALGQVAPEMQAFALGTAAAAKIYGTIDRLPDINPDDPENAILAPELVKGHIRVSNVVFAYPSRADVTVLKDFSLDIEAGTTVALVGASGSGKSTIIQLLERFYDPLSGSIHFDDVAIDKLQLKWLRIQIGLVSQEPTLFEGTVAENVAFGLIGSVNEHTVGEERRVLVENACKMANAHEFILKLPNGYETPVGERGLLMSGGQKQRIAIARAIVKNPKVLLLDEATSALDTTSERLVQDALDKASIGRTTIVIAHRLSTIRTAQKIVVMDKGVIVECGTHNELIAQEGMYKRLVEAQKLTKEEEVTGVSQLELKEEEVAAPQSERRHSKASSINADIEQGQKRSLSSFAVFRKIFVLNYPELKFIIPGFVSAIVAGLVYPFFAIVFASIIQVFSKTGDELRNGANFWAGMFVVIAVVTFFSNFLMNTLFGFASELLTERIRNKTFSAILSQDVSFFDDEANTVGALTSSLSSDAQMIQGISGVTLGTLLTVAVNLIGGMIIALIYGWKLGLVATFCVPMLVFSGLFRIKIVSYFAEKARGSYEKSAQVACEAVAAIKTVQSLTRENEVQAKYDAILAIPLRDGIKSAWTNTALYALSQSLNFLVNALVFYYGGHLIAYEGYGLQQFFTIFIAVVFGSQGAGRIFAYAPDLKKAKDAGEGVLNLLDRVPLSKNSGKSLVKIEKGDVEFISVKFNYPLRPHIKVLKGLDMNIKAGQFVALVGNSGCGKSTSVGLIERFYDIRFGAIKIDGIDINTFDTVSLREQIGLVSQEPNLFDMTIRENIGFGCTTPPSQAEIETAAKAANIHEFVMALPLCYETRIGAKGGQLSGGQKQRIAIARALIKNPKILLLDEATSALDAESEKVVQAALDNAAKGRTTISIAHRLSTIQKADVIFVFKAGVVHEKGTHQELLKVRGLYYELVQQQDLGTVG